MARCALTTFEPPTPCVVRQTPVHSRSTLKLKLKLKYRPDNSIRFAMSPGSAKRTGPATVPPRVLPCSRLHHRHDGGFSFSMPTGSVAEVSRRAPPLRTAPRLQ